MYKSAGVLALKVRFEMPPAMISSSPWFISAPIPIEKARIPGVPFTAVAAAMVLAGSSDLPSESTSMFCKVPRKTALICCNVTLRARSVRVVPGT